MRPAAAAAAATASRIGRGPSGGAGLGHGLGLGLVSLRIRGRVPVAVGLAVGRSATARFVAICPCLLRGGGGDRGGGGGGDGRLSVRGVRRMSSPADPNSSSLKSSEPSKDGSKAPESESEEKPSLGPEEAEQPGSPPGEGAPKEQSPQQQEHQLPDSASTPSTDAATTPSPSRTSSPTPADIPSTTPPPFSSDAVPDLPTFSSSSDPSTTLTPLQQAIAARKATASAAASRLIDALQARMLGASATLNSMTGYTPIEQIKTENDMLERQLHSLQSRVRTARAAYKTTNSRRAATQREVTALLARKDAWSPHDLERFTSLYRDDHTVEHEVAAAATELADAEAEEQAVGARLNQGILRRYHEEQIWSDRIRRASTWGTWGLMGVNVLLFLVLQFVAEPWRRRRLVKGVVEEEHGVLDEVRAQLALVRAALERGETRSRLKEEGRREREREMELVRKRERLEKEAAELERIRAEQEAAAAQQPQPQPQSQQPHHQPQPPPSQQHQQQNHQRRRKQPLPALLASLASLGSRAASSANWADALARAAPGRLRPVLEDLASERRVEMRMRDVSLVALEGVVAGAALSGGIFALVFALRS